VVQALEDVSVVLRSRQFVDWLVDDDLTGVDNGEVFDFDGNNNE